MIRYVNSEEFKSDFSIGYPSKQFEFFMNSLRNHNMRNLFKNVQNGVSGIVQTPIARLILAQNLSSLLFSKLLFG